MFKHLDANDNPVNSDKMIKDLNLGKKTIPMNQENFLK